MEVIEHHRAEPGQGQAALAAEGWLHRPGTARAILVASLLITALAWWAARHFAIDEARQRFARHSDDVQARIAHRMAAYVAVLRSGAALFAADGQVSRDQWRRFAEVVNLQDHYPGIQGFGVARLLRSDELAAHQAAVRAEGFPDYTVRPPGQRELYSSIVYLEPFTGRNLRAFGFDMLSEATRRTAMLRARDSGDAALSGIVTLVQEDGQQVQRGFLIYLPVYQGGREPVTEAGRQSRLWGWVYAPFRVQDLMQGILGGSTGQLHVAIHDGANPQGAPFYSSDAAAKTDDAGGFNRRLPLQVAGRTWTIDYTGADYQSAADTWQSNLVAACGVSIDLLLYWTIVQLNRRRRQVEAQVLHHGRVAGQRTAWLDAVSGLSPDGVLVFQRGADEQHRLVYTNPAFSRLWGLRPEDLLGLSEPAAGEWLAGLTEPGQAQAPLCDAEGQVALAGPPRRVLQRRLRESGDQRVYYFRDVTRETEVDRLKSEFLTTAAHELRTPLASVYGFSELLLADKVPEAKRQRALSIVNRQASVLKHLVDELLDLARIDSKGDEDFQRGLHNLHLVAQEAVESVLRPDQAPRVLLAPCDEPLWVLVDPVRMRQAVLNLLSNGLKYSPEDSIVTLGLSSGVHAGQPVARLVVADQGIGMSALQLARAGERFYRADPSGHIAGTGLGLAISKEIVTLHGGRFTLRSEAGSGTEAIIELPLQDAPRGSPAAPAAVPREVALTS